MQTNADAQQMVFEQLISKKHDILNLASYVQNDFERMLKDKITTKKKIGKNLRSMEHDFDSLLHELLEIKFEMRNLMERYTKKGE